MVIPRRWLLYALAGALGAGVLLALKYRLIGLEAWDRMLHPERLPCDVPGAEE